MVYHCAACDEEFDSQEELADHSAGVTRDQAYRCCVCWMTFRNRYTHRMHVRRHVGMNPYVCETCGKGFEVKRKLEQHARTHCNNSKYPHRCQVCGKGFRNTQGLGSHMLVHKAKGLRPSFAKKKPTPSVPSSPARPQFFMGSPTHYSRWPSGDRIIRPFYHDLILPIKQSPRSDSDRYDIVRTTTVNRRKVHSKPRPYPTDYSQQGIASGGSDAEDMKPLTSPDLLENCLASGFVQCEQAHKGRNKLENINRFTSTPIRRPTKARKKTTPLEHVINNLRQKAAQTTHDDSTVDDVNNDTSYDSGVQGSSGQPSDDKNDEEQREQRDDDADDSPTTVSGVLVARVPLFDLLSAREETTEAHVSNQNDTESSNDRETSDSGHIHNYFSTGDEADDELEIQVANQTFTEVNSNEEEEPEKDYIEPTQAYYEFSAGEANEEISEDHHHVHREYSSDEDNEEESENHHIEPHDIHGENSPGEGNEEEYEEHNIQSHDFHQIYSAGEGNKDLPQSITSDHETEYVQRLDLKKCYVVLKDVLKSESGLKYLSRNLAPVARTGNNLSSTRNKGNVTRNAEGSLQLPAERDKLKDDVSDTRQKQSATNKSPRRRCGKREMQLLLEPHGRTQSGTTPLVYLLSRNRGERRNRLFRATISNKRPRYFSTDSSLTEEEPVEAAPVRTLRKTRARTQPMATYNTTETSDEDNNNDSSDSGLAVNVKDVSVQLDDVMASKEISSSETNKRSGCSIMLRHTSTDTESSDHRGEQTGSTPSHQNEELHEHLSSMNESRDDVFDFQTQEDIETDGPSDETSSVASSLSQRITRQMCSARKDGEHVEEGLKKDVLKSKPNQYVERKRTKPMEGNVEKSSSGRTARKRIRTMCTKFGRTVSNVYKEASVTDEENIPTGFPKSLHTRSAEYKDPDVRDRLAEYDDVREGFSAAQGSQNNRTEAMQSTDFVKIIPGFDHSLQVSPRTVQCMQPFKELRVKLIDVMSQEGTEFRCTGESKTYNLIRPGKRRLSGRTKGGKTGDFSIPKPPHVGEMVEQPIELSASAEKSQIEKSLPLDETVIEHRNQCTVSKPNPLQDNSLALESTVGTDISDNTCSAQYDVDQSQKTTLFKNVQTLDQVHPKGVHETTVCTDDAMEGCSLGDINNNLDAHVNDKENNRKLASVLNQQCRVRLTNIALSSSGSSNRYKKHAADTPDSHVIEKDSGKETPEVIGNNRTVPWSDISIPGSAIETADEALDYDYTYTLPGELNRTETHTSLDRNRHKIPALQIDEVNGTLTTSPEMNTKGNKGIDKRSLHVPEEKSSKIVHVTLSPTKTTAILGTSVNSADKMDEIDGGGNLYLQESRYCGLENTVTNGKVNKPVERHCNLGSENEEQFSSSESSKQQTPNAETNVGDSEVQLPSLSSIESAPTTESQVKDKCVGDIIDNHCDTQEEQPELETNLHDTYPLQTQEYMISNPEENIESNVLTDICLFPPENQVDVVTTDIGDIPTYDEGGAIINLQVFTHETAEGGTIISLGDGYSIVGADEFVCSEIVQGDTDINANIATEDLVCDNSTEPNTDMTHIESQYYDKSQQENIDSLHTEMDTGTSHEDMIGPGVNNQPGTSVEEESRDDDDDDENEETTILESLLPSSWVTDSQKSPNVSSQVHSLQDVAAVGKKTLNNGPQFGIANISPLEKDELKSTVEKIFSDGHKNARWSDSSVMAPCMPLVDMLAPKSGNYKCPVCKKEFGRKGTLLVHAKIHSSQTLSSLQEEPEQHPDKQKLKVTIPPSPREWSPESASPLSSASGDSFDKGDEAYSPPNVTSNAQVEHSAAEETKQSPHPGESAIEAVRTSDGGFLCPICSKKFHLSDALKAHLNVHIGVFPYKCIYCEKCFQYRGSLVYHYRDVHPDRKYASLKSPLRDHNQDVHFKQPKHGAFGSSNSDITFNNDNRKPAVKKLTCPYCEMEFRLWSTLEEHINIHTGDTPYECDMCHKRFKQQAALYGHYQRAHPEVRYTSGVQNRGWGRQEVSTSFFPKEKTLECSSSRNQRDHTQVPSENESGSLRVTSTPAGYKCPVCSKTFRLRDTAEAHLNLHTGFTPYECIYCGKKFKQRAGLYHHCRRIHAGMPFTSVKNQKTDTNLSVKRDFDDHLTCPVCRRVFNSRDSLKDHVRIHASVNTVTCNICNESFKGRVALYYHKRDVHGMTNIWSPHSEGDAMTSAELTCLTEAGASGLDNNSQTGKKVDKSSLERMVVNAAATLHIKSKLPIEKLRDLLLRSQVVSDTVRHQEAMIDSQLPSTSLHLLGSSHPNNERITAQANSESVDKPFAGHTDHQNAPNSPKTPSDVEFPLDALLSNDTEFHISPEVERFVLSMCEDDDAVLQVVHTDPAGNLTAADGTALHLPQISINTEDISSTQEANNFDDLMQHEDILSIASREILGPGGEDDLISEEAYDYNLTWTSAAYSQFECYFCGKAFVGKDTYDAHMKSHSGEKPYPCGLCGVSFKNYISRYQHYRRAHPGHPPPSSKSQGYRCHICGLRCNGARGLSIHLQGHSDQTLFSCNQCDKKFKFQISLRAHIRNVHLGHGTPGYLCPDCGAGYSWLSKLCQHYIVTHSYQPSYQCATCGTDFEMLRMYLEHVQVHSAHRPFTCDLCKKTFTTKRLLSHHMYTHVRNGSHRCWKCSHPFNTIAELHRHEATHGQQNGRAFSCNQCGKSFNLRRDLDIHQQHHEDGLLCTCHLCGVDNVIINNNNNMHSVNRNELQKFKCEVCNKVFSRLSTLDNHRLEHQVRQPKASGQQQIHSSAEQTVKYKCPRCQKMFSSPSSLWRHIGRHNGSKAHECDACGLAYSRRSTLEAHLVTHEQGNSHKCSVCGKEFIKWEDLNSHKLLHRDPSGNMRHICQVCHVRYEELPQLLDHQRASHRALNPNECPICLKLFPSFGYLKVHSRNHPNKHRPHCIQCHRSFKTMTQKLSHQIRHLRRRRANGCFICNKQFHSSVTLKSHQWLIHRRKSGSRQAFVSCTICDRQFSNEAHRRLHIHTHKSSKKHTCQVCKKAFRFIGNLENHKEQCSANIEKTVETPDITSAMLLNQELVTSHLSNAEYDKSVEQSNTNVVLHDVLQQEENNNTSTFSMEKDMGQADIFSMELVKLQQHQTTSVDQSGFKTIDTSQLDQGSEPAAGDSIKEQQEYQCSRCNRGFTRRKQLKRHMATGCKFKGVECPICHKTYMSKVGLRLHDMSHTGKKPFQCSVCGRSFTQRPLLTRHMYQHTGERPHSCLVCNKGFVDKYAFLLHMKKQHPGQSIPSSPSSRSSSIGSPNASYSPVNTMPSQGYSDSPANTLSAPGFSDSPVTRLPVQESTDECESSCPLCGDLFSSRKKLKEHVKKQHGGKNKHVCYKCGKVFRTPSGLYQHKRTHNREKQYKCSICGRGFNQKGPLNRHMRLHTGERPYQCSKCSRRFIDRTALNRHLDKDHDEDTDEQPEVEQETEPEEVEQEEQQPQKAREVVKTRRWLNEKKPQPPSSDVSVVKLRDNAYQCSSCKKTFKTFYLCKQHMLLHEQNFQCLTCGEYFSSKGELASHLSQHLDEKPFACETCGERFTNKLALDRHKAFHADESSLFCQLCGSQFSTREALRKHSMESCSVVQGLQREHDDD